VSRCNVTCLDNSNSCVPLLPVSAIGHPSPHALSCTDRLQFDSRVNHREVMLLLFHGKPLQLQFLVVLGSVSSKLSGSVLPVAPKGVKKEYSCSLRCYCMQDSVISVSFVCN
jgi:hypothetical protein